MPDWNPQLYLKFSDQRGRPAADLIAQIQLDSPKQVIDLGCGTGNSTERLHRRWPEARIAGVDSSPAMLQQASKNHPEWNWIESTIERWVPATAYNLIFSNAALHWVPQHQALFPRLLQQLAPGGALAVQMPHNFGSPATQAMRRVAADLRWSAALAAEGESTFVQAPDFYYNVLRKLASRLNIWETEYLQIMDGPHAVLDWLRSTGMRPYLERLPDDAQRQQFEAMCLREFEMAYPADDQGKALFPYRRMFIIAYC